MSGPITAVLDGRTVEALQFTGNFDALERFVGGDAEWRKHQFVVAGPDGAIRGHFTDWVLRMGDTFGVLSDVDFQKEREDQ